MGTFPINCPECGRLFIWFSGTMDQRCDKCRQPALPKAMTDEEFLKSLGEPTEVGTYQQCVPVVSPTHPTGPVEGAREIVQMVYDYMNVVECKNACDPEVGFHAPECYIAQQCYHWLRKHGGRV